MPSIAGRYQILETIGRGAMGIVYKALDSRFNRVVALKVLNADLRDDSTYRERFVREAHTMGALSHPNIVRFYELGESDGKSFMVLEYIDGHSLAESMKDGQPCDLDYSVEIIQQVGAALSYAHRHGVIHRDIKPNNILISTSNRVVVSDFGVAKAAAASSLTEIGTVLGTPAYMSPEQAKGLRLDERSDLFCLAILMYQLVTAKRPFAGHDMTESLYNLVTQPPTPLSELNPSLPSALETTLLKALAKDPSLRHSSVDEFVSEVVRCCGEASLARTPGPRPNPLHPDIHGNTAPSSLRSDFSDATREALPYTPGSIARTAPLLRKPGDMAWFLVLNGPQRGQKLSLSERVTLGRAPDCDLVFADESLSRQHATVYFQGDSFHIADRGSSNGTLVNGLRVQQQALHDRDEIHIGKTILLFVQAASPDDLNAEAKRRLRDLDDVWKLLTQAARHGG